jgi:ATP-binding cassette subfamily B protein
VQAAGPTRPGTASRIVARCLGYLRPYWTFSAGAYLLLLVNNGISLAQPLIIRNIVDNGIRGGSVSAIQAGAALLLGITLVKGAFTFLYGRWTEIASQNVSYDLRNQIHSKLQSLSFSYHDRAETGQLLTRAISDVDRVRFLTGRALVSLSQLIVLILGIGISMMLMHVGLALVTMAVVPILAYAAMRFGRTLRPLWRSLQQALSVLTARLEQNLRGARIVAAFAQEGAEVGHLSDENAELLALNLRAGRLRAVFLPLMSLLASVGTVGVLLYGGFLAIQGRLTIGELVAFTAYVAQLLMPTRRLGWIIAAVSQAVASGTRIFEILDAESEVTDAPDAEPMGEIRGHVRFENVSFAYFGRHRVLDSVAFEVRPGEVVALLGATGSGKSSVINLVPRFYDPTEGRVLIDGSDIRLVTINSLRDQIGIVLQDTTLFAASVAENIRFGRPGASDEELFAAARAARAHGFIMDMPEGYETHVGERGVTVSGGQKQRIAIARALLKDPRILILDDATSSVDSATERLVQEALARLMEGRTSFVIAQRLSTIRRADQILVLEGGRITAHGRRTADRSAHDQLLETSGLYAEIYHRQLRPQSLGEGSPASLRSSALGGRQEARVPA